MEPSDPAASPWSRREPPCAVQGTALCPYPVVQWQPVFSSLGEGEGKEEVIKEEEDEAAGEEEDDDMVAVTVIDNDN
jgi:hypothetical protein